MAQAAIAPKNSDAIYADQMVVSQKFLFLRKDIYISKKAHVLFVNFLFNYRQLDKYWDLEQRTKEENNRTKCKRGQVAYNDKK